MSGAPQHLGRCSPMDATSAKWQSPRAMTLLTCLVWDSSIASCSVTSLGVSPHLHAAAGSLHSVAVMGLETYSLPCYKHGPSGSEGIWVKIRPEVFSGDCVTQPSLQQYQPSVRMRDQLVIQPYSKGPPAAVLFCSLPQHQFCHFTGFTSRINLWTVWIHQVSVWE